MTIIVGIICKEGLVIGSDSQASSFRGVQVKRSDYTKISEFGVNDDLNLVVSGAGVGAFISKFIDKLRESCNSTKIKTTNQVADMAEDVMIEMQKRYVVEKAEKLGFTKKVKMQETLRKSQLPEVPGFVIMIGITEKNGQNPTIYTVTPEGIAERAEKFDSTGSGSAYAEYLLAKFHQLDMTIGQAINLGVYVIEEVKKIDPNCGGATQIVAIDKKGIRRLQSEEIKAIVDEISKIDTCANKVWRALINKEKNCEEVEEFIGSAKKNKQ
jgi:20S proteasome alpha/beta subunit